MVGTDSRWYFDPIFQEWENGGKEHFFKYITHQRMMDKSQEINYITDRPHTTGRSDQLLQTEPLLGYFHNLLVQGGHRVRDPHNNRSWTIMKWNQSEKNKIYITDQIHDDYSDFCRSQKLGRWVQDKNQLGKELVEMGKYIDFRSYRVNPTSKTHPENLSGQTTCWEFGSLKECKEKWVQTVFGGDEKSCWGEYDDGVSGGYTPALFSSPEFNSEK